MKHRLRLLTLVLIVVIIVSFTACTTPTIPETTAAEITAAETTAPDISNETIEEQPSDIPEGSQYVPNYVYVKYRDGLVDIANPRFEYLDTSKSSLVRGAWYDDDNQYMIINLTGTYYHYCGMPTSIWNSFKLTDSFGSFYNSHIKGRYDCREYPIPQYEDVN